MNNQDIFLKYYSRYSHSEQSVNMRRSCLKYFFGENYFNYSGKIFDINTRILIDYFDYLNQLKTISKSTKRNKWAILISFLEFCMEYYHEKKFIVIIPKKTIQWKTTHKKPKSNKTVIANKEEIKVILDYLKLYNYKHYIIFRLFAETGIRKGELINARVQDLDIEKRYIIGIGKTGEKCYFFSQDLAKHLNLYLKERKKINISHDYLFLSNRYTKYAHRTFNKFLKQICKQLGITKNITCHTFRRTLNTLRKEMGCPNEDRKILLNHKTSDVNIESYVVYETENYINLFDQWNPFHNQNL